MTVRPRRSRGAAWPLFAVALVLAGLGGFASRAHAFFPEHTDAVPTPAADPGYPVNTLGAGFTLPPQFVDLEHDGRYQVMAVDNLGVIYIVGQNGVEAGGWPMALGSPVAGLPAVGDLDGDGVPDVAVVLANGQVKGFTKTGALKFAAFQLPALPLGGPVLAEMDTTGQLSIVVATQDGAIHAINTKGQECPGFPVATGNPARSGAFTFIAGDNFPRVGVLNSAGAQIYYTYGLLDAQYSFNPGPLLGPAAPVSGARIVSGLLDQDNLFVSGHDGQWWRLDPSVISVGGAATPMTGVSGDSVLDTPALVDVNGDMQPELAFRSLRADTLSVWLVDGGTGAPLTGWPKRYLASAPGGGIVAADLGDGATPEIIFNQGGTKLTCLKSDGTTAWSILGISTVGSPAVGDLDGDGALDMAVATTDGQIQVYTLGTGGVGPKGVEWPGPDGTPDHGRRHHLRDRAALRPQWPPPLVPQSAYTTRPVFGDLNNDGRLDAIWSDETSGKTYAWLLASGTLPGWAQSYPNGGVNDAPAVGDVTGDGVFETVQSTATGYVEWGDKSGVMHSMLVDAAHVLTPPTLVDLNGDGVLDVIVGSDSGRLYGLNLVNQTVIPGWGSPSALTVSGPVTLPVSVGDITGDGNADVVVVSGGRVLNAFPRTGGAQLAGWPKTFIAGASITQPILVPVSGNPGLAVAFGMARTDSTVLTVNLVGANGSPLAGWPRRLLGSAIFGPVAGDFTNDGQPDFGYSTDTDSMYVYVANGTRAITKYFNSPTTIEVFAMVDCDLDQRPELVAVSDHSQVLGLRFNGLFVRSFDRLLYYIDSGQPPAFADMGNTGTMQMALSDLGSPILYEFGFNSWNRQYAPWPMKGHDARRTNAYSGLTVVGVDNPPLGLAALGAEWARALPNPSLEGVALTHSRPLVGRYEAAIYDLRGRLVRRIAAGAALAGDAAPRWTWDGRDEGGHTATAGVYFYRVVDARGALSTRIVRMR